VFIAVILAAFFGFRLIINKIDAAATATVVAAKNEVRQYARKAEALTREIAAFAERTAARFKTGTITQTFTEEIPVFRSLGMGRLEVSVSDPVPVTFHKSDTRKILWDWIYLGQTVSEIRVPATYRYHVPLDGNWTLRVEDKMCIVVPPAIQPSLPVAIHTDRLEKQTVNGWARFDKAEQLDDLERSITPRLNELAADPAHFDAARDEARETIANFVSAWLMREHQWGNTFTSIIVIFPDEPTPKVPFRPTLHFQPKP
jgi:hypothetical protein